MSYIGRKRADFPYLKDSPPSLGADTRSVAPHPLLDFFRPFICPPSLPESDPGELQSMQVFSRPLDLPPSLARLPDKGGRERSGGEF